jgi:hypothetical protein
VVFDYGQISSSGSIIYVVLEGGVKVALAVVTTPWISLVTFVKRRYFYFSLSPPCLTIPLFVTTPYLFMSRSGIAVFDALVSCKLMGRRPLYIGTGRGTTDPLTGLDFP